MTDPLSSNVETITRGPEGSVGGNGTKRSGSPPPGGIPGSSHDDPQKRLRVAENCRRFGARLMIAVHMVPLLAMLSTIVAYLIAGTLSEPDSLPKANMATFQDWKPWVSYLAVGLGALIALLCWVGQALVSRYSATVKGANPRNYRDLYSRYRNLDARIEASCPAGKPASTDPQDVDPTGQSVIAACKEAYTHKEYLAEQLGIGGRLREDVSWVLAKGYNDLWSQVHRAEEALIEVEPSEDVIGDAVHDLLRLEGCAIGNGKTLSDKVHQAVGVLSQSALQYLTPLPSAATRADDSSRAPVPPPQEATPDKIAQDRADARAVLREVRNVINEFRDARWEGLVRVRHQLVNTVTFTGFATYVMLALAIIMGAPRHAILAAATFFLVGALVGLFNRLSLDAKVDSSVEEDHGLERMRLFHTPLFSGLAALGGVVIIAMLPVLVNTDVLKPQAAPTPVAAIATATANALPAGASGPAVSAEIPKLEDIFNLERNAFGLIIAATFGLTPTLFTTTLQRQVQKLKEDLKSTEAQQSTS